MCNRVDGLGEIRQDDGQLLTVAGGEYGGLYILVDLGCARLVTRLQCDLKPSQDLSTMSVVSSKGLRLVLGICMVTSAPVSRIAYSLEVLLL